MSESTFHPPETLPCSRCDREMQFDALDVVTRLFVYVCQCGNERQLTRPEIERSLFGNVVIGRPDETL